MVGCLANLVNGPHQPANQFVGSFQRAHSRNAVAVQVADDARHGAEAMAVLLHTAGANLLPGGRAAVAYAEPAGADLADAARLCRTAARMWTDASDVDPAVIWRAACAVAG